MLAILAHPEDDAPRKELARFLRPADPDWAEFIEIQLDRARERRLDHERTQSTSNREMSLRGENKERWTRDLGFYMGERGIHRQVEFDRGLPWLCTLNPYMLLQEGEHILSHIAPLRGVSFFDDPEGDPFPMKQLAASPLLAHFDEIRFTRCKITDEDIETLASSPYLERLMVLDICGANQLSLRSLEVLAANPATRKCLKIDFDVCGADRGLVGEFTERDEYGYYDFEMSAEGHALERTYGYLPWLHLWNAPGYAADAHYWVEHKILPLFVTGSPGDAPTPYGTGVWQRQKPMLPRTDARRFLIQYR
jgi:hypothetical protein